jgi:hypothetical protein
MGYARTSTVDQIAGLDAQVRDLEAGGAEKVFSERVFGDETPATRSCVGVLSRR